MTEPRQFRDEPVTQEVQSANTVFRGWVWNIESETFDYGEGTLTREFVDHTGAVAILALDEDDRALFVQQYRHPARTRDWELPAGLLDAPGESALAAAKRELAEEADLSAARWDLLLDFWTSPGGSSESIRIYLARELTSLDPFERTAEEADIVTAWVPLDEALDAVMRGDLHNPAALQAIFAATEARRRRWSTLRPADTEWDTRPTGPRVLPKALADGGHK